MIVTIINNDSYLPLITLIIIIHILPLELLFNDYHYDVAANYTYNITIITLPLHY